ncbi:MAG: DUF1501 domain-containing protein [Planctomycetes bacterium]|nr:DUF1501 domain-containing protein [Planctomycetota bacterium]
MNPADFFAIQGRRRFLKRTACGLGMIALAELLHREGRTGEAAPRSDPARPKPPHFPSPAKNVIFLFMAGGPSQLDLFDPKPVMKKLHGEPVPESFLKTLDDALIRGSARVMASPRTFKKYGQCGMDFSDFLPRLATCADDLCMVRSLVSHLSNHDPAQLLMNCGTPLYGHPSMGSWVTYGLGSESEDLPGFVVLLSNSGKGVDGGSALWSNGFLPSAYRGVTFRSSGDPILHLTSPKGVHTATQRARLAAIQDLNRIHEETTGDSEIASRIAAYELAYRMQAAAPELLDFSKESTATLESYGIHNDTTRWFGTNCLLARRMVERGVRFVQLYHSTWDDHSELNKHLRINTAMTDQPAAALIQDLKSRGLLDETLVIWGGEFGRTPMYEIRRGPGMDPEKAGRDHHPFGFTMLLAGGGIRGGQIVGQTDELGYNTVEDRIHVHDLQATILHCLGIDHTRLTYRHQGRDFRLTDVSGRLVHKLLV